MFAASKIRIKPTFEFILPMVLFGGCLLHRLIQLNLLWPHLIDQAVHADHIMQLLPAAVWREHFGAGLLYLQQAPPVPNLVFGILSWLLPDAQHLSYSILCLQIILASLSVALFGSLLLRYCLPGWVCLSVPAILFFSVDLIVMEYNVMGHFFYEQTTMLLCLLACHSALSYQDSGRPGALLLIGLWVALLALTRSTFSYFALPAALWVLVFSRQKRIAALAVFLLPIVLLHGSWSIKNLLVHGYWSTATSTWGGANARTGDIRRSGGEDLNQWLQQQESLCDTAWWQMVQQYSRPIFFFPDKEWILSFPQPERVLQANQQMEKARGQLVFFDTDTIRLYSQCLQRIYLRYWLHHPLETVIGAWRSYQLFWLPIREFVARNPIPVAPPAIQVENTPNPAIWLRHAFGELGDNAYRYVYLDFDTEPVSLVYRDIELLALPALPLLLQAIFFVVIHAGFLFLLGGIVCHPLRPLHTDWQRLSFPLLCIFYVAGITSLVEYGENMRFRLEVEPLIWAVSLVIIRRLYCSLRCHKHNPLPAKQGTGNK